MTSMLPLLRAGSARVEFLEGNPLDHVSQSLYASVNARGVMASGLPGAIRLAAGLEFERELRARGDLLEGRAYLVHPWALERRGVEVIACGVTTSGPGLPPKRQHVIDAVSKALELLDDASMRGITLPEVGTRIPGISLRDAAILLATILMSFLRRSTQAFEIRIVGLHSEYLMQCHSELARIGAVLD